MWLPENEWNAEPAGKLGRRQIPSCVTDFYLTNPIARSSKLMAELSANAKARRAEAIAAE